MAPQEIKIGGLGGQGVILAAIIIGKAAALFDDKHSTLTQAFGPEARGSACSAQVVLDDDPILYPYVTSPNFMVTMSQDAFARFSPELREDGVLLYDEDLVKPAGLPAGVTTYGIPATRLAEQLGRKQVLNIIMVGFFTAVTGLVSEKGARASVTDSVPPSTVDLNMRAFDAGFSHGKQLRAKSA